MLLESRLVDNPEQTPAPDPLDVDSLETMAAGAPVCGIPRPPRVSDDRFWTLRADCDTRPVDWRWQRAAAIVTTPRPLRGTEDPRVADVVRRLQAESLAPDDLGARLHQELLGDARHRLIELQAFLMSGEGLERTAARFALDPDGLGLYAALFFDVLGEPLGSGWLRHTACGPRRYPCPALDDEETLLKAAACDGGVAVLEDVLWCLRTPRPEAPRKLKDLPYEELVRLRRWMRVRQYLLWETFIPKTASEQLRLEMLCATAG